MANTKQARKRIRQNETARLRNRSIRSDYRSALKAFLRTVRDGKLEEADQAVRTAESKIDRAAKRNAIHSGKADRIKAKMKARLHACQQAAAAK